MTRMCSLLIRKRRQAARRSCRSRGSTASRYSLSSPTATTPANYFIGWQCPIRSAPMPSSSIATRRRASLITSRPSYSAPASTIRTATSSPISRSDGKACPTTKCRAGWNSPSVKEIAGCRSPESGRPREPPHQLVELLEALVADLHGPAGIAVVDGDVQAQRIADALLKCERVGVLLLGGAAATSARLLRLALRHALFMRQRFGLAHVEARSEERRVGQEGRAVRWTGRQNE